MSLKTQEPEPVSADEVARRIAEYCRIGFEGKAPPQVVYGESCAECPWPGCGLRINGIHFRLEQWNNAADQERLLQAWWRGPGLVGLCPNCRRHVLFSVTAKTAVPSTAAYSKALLPDDWHTKAHVVTRPTASQQ